MKLDQKDRLLLLILSHDAQLTNRDLAARVGLAPSSCHARVKRLEAQGIIAGYRAVLGSPARSGRIDGWAQVRLLDAAPEAAQAFARLISETPEIVEAHRTTGRYDFLVRFCACDLADWQTFHRRLEILDAHAQSQLTLLLEPIKPG